MHHMARNGVRAPQQAGGVVHVALAQRLAHGGTGDAQPLDLITVHAGHIKAEVVPGFVQHRVVACALGTKTKVVADQHVAYAQALYQHVVNEGLRCLAGEGGVKGQHHRLIDAAACQLLQLVAQRGDTCRGQLGLASDLGEVVTRVRLEGHHAAGHFAVLGLTVEQRQHGLMTPVDTVKVADGQRASVGDVGMVKTAKNLHEVNSISFL